MTIYFSLPLLFWCSWLVSQFQFNVYKMPLSWNCSIVQSQNVVQSSKYGFTMHLTPNMTLLLNSLCLWIKPARITCSWSMQISNKQHSARRRRLRVSWALFWFDVFEKKVFCNTRSFDTYLSHCWSFLGETVLSILCLCPLGAGWNGVLCVVDC